MAVYYPAMAPAPTLDSDISRIFAHYKNDMLAIRHLHETDENPREVVREITDATDSLIIRLILDLAQKRLNMDDLPGHILLLAQGGYGRRELHPQSDIDLLFLYSKSLDGKEQELIKEFYRTLYDMGFKVGHTCRSCREAIDPAVDPHSQTAMWESRFLAGDWRLFEKFKTDLWHSLRRGRKEHIRRKIAEREERINRFGQTINITEPNIKESLGGLRDYHFGLWLGSLNKCQTMNLVHLMRSHLIDDQRMSRVRDAITFLWRLRNDLHFTTKKEQDVLAMPLQHETSLRLGYQDRRGRLAEEEMMRDYFQHATTLSNFAKHMINKCSPAPFFSHFRIKARKPLAEGFFMRDNRIHIPPDLHFFEHNPQRLITAFIHAAEQKTILSEEAATAVRDNLELVDQAFLHDKDSAALLRKFFSLPFSVENAIQEMRKTGLWECLFPEWRGIANLVRYDLVHRYTVDEHSFLCLYHLEHLFEDTMKYAAERSLLWRDCKDKDALRLAVLCHDIGKGRNGDHSLIGARLADDIARRMRLPERKRKQLVFLIAHHLLMSQTAQRRDLSDSQTAGDFSDAFESIDDLDMMYLLTYVDMRSVSPESMTEWKNNLLWQLYLAARELFVSDSPDEKVLGDHILTQKEKIIAKLTPEYDHRLIQEHLDYLPPSYLLNQSIDNIRQHLKALQRHEAGKAVIDIYPHIDPSCLEIVLVTKDKVGLFNRICTAVMLENFSIEEARLNTRSDGIVANNIVIRETLGEKRIDKSRQLLLQERLHKILTLEGKLPRIPKSPGQSQLGRSSFEKRVKIFNDISAKYNILEIRCADRRGLLQDLTSILSEMKMNIYFARIITEGNRVTDVFYIADAAGEKIQDEQALSELKTSIDAVLELDENHG
ncbi:MAG: [protein-PII] uridylyltransferase [Candidatus Omnitrophota bacterium]